MSEIQEGYYNTITLNQVISSVRAQLRIDTSDDDIWIEKLVNEGVRHLDGLSIFVKSFACLTVEDSRAKLPHGYHSLIGIRFKQPDIENTDGTIITSQNYFGVTYVDLSFIQSSTSTNNVAVSSSYQIIGGCIQFNNTIEDGAKIQLAYWGLNVDNDGLFVVYEDYERALTAYACWKYCLQNYDKYPNNLYSTYMLEWKAQKKWIKSNDVRDHFQKNKRAMASTMNAIINAKTWEV